MTMYQENDKEFSDNVETHILGCNSVSVYKHEP